MSGFEEVRFCRHWSFTMKSLILLTLLAAGVAVKSPRLKFVLQGKTGCHVDRHINVCVFYF